MAFRPAGRAFSSGLACVNGCPGGASGRRIEPMIDCFRFRRFDREDFIGLELVRFHRDAIPVQEHCQLFFSSQLMSLLRAGLCSLLQILLDRIRQGARALPGR